MKITEEEKEQDNGRGKKEQSCKPENQEEHEKGKGTNEQCQGIEESIKKNNSKEAHQLVKDLTSTKHGRTNSMQGKNGNRLTEDRGILKRWTEYCAELYNHAYSHR